MKAVEFCYWLQGYFEMASAAGRPVDHLDTGEVKCIRAHLALVKKADPKHSNAFVLWLDLMMRSAVSASPSGGDGTWFSSAEAIRATLAAQFEHVIDKSYGGDQKELGELHGIGGVGPDGQLYRC